jgi:hypothetical protein
MHDCLSRSTIATATSLCAIRSGQAVLSGNVRSGTVTLVKLMRCAEPAPKLLSQIDEQCGNMRASI